MRATVFGLLGGIVLATLSTSALADGTTRPDALLMVDQHREAIVERVIKAWPEALTAEQASVLRGTLAGLRADRLLAISISPGLGSLLGVLNGVDKAEAAKGALVAIKALGDAGATLYTPVTPCRLFDTRVSQGGMGAPYLGVRRTYGAITPVVNQGGPGGCAAGSGATAALIQIGTLTPAGNGLLQGGPQGAASFPNALILYQAGDQYGTAVVMPLNPANGQFDLVQQFATADLYGDLLGYFKPPGDATSLDIKVAGVQRVMRFEYNAISPNLIGGSPANGVTAGAHGATVAGGGVPLGDTDPYFGFEAPNRVTDAYGTVGGGYGNRAGDDAGTPFDQALATVGGGYANTASGNGSTVGGGLGNTSSGMGSTVVGGMNNIAAANMSAVVGGLQNNVVAGYGGAIVGGAYNSVGGGISSIVAGGSYNIASGDHSFAAGYYALANYPGCFVWSDTTSQFRTLCRNRDQFVARSLGGFYFWTAGDMDQHYSGAQLAPGSGAWSSYSDRNGKENVERVDAIAVLEKVVSMPVATWNWKAQDARIRHMGPMAQDFYAAFGLGEGDTTIGTVDADGVVLAAIQGLNAKLGEKDGEIDSLKAEVAELRRAVEVLMARTSPEGRVAQTR